MKEEGKGGRKKKNISEFMFSKTEIQPFSVTNHGMFFFPALCTFFH